MNGDCEDDQTDVYVKCLKESKVVIDQIKRLLKRKDALEDFTRIPLNCVGDSVIVVDDLFMDMVLAKFTAQHKLNCLYNPDYHLRLSVYQPIKFTLENKKHDNEEDDCGYAILRYLVLRRMIWQQDVQFKKEELPLKKCPCCNSEVQEDESKCPICFSEQDYKILRVNERSEPMPSENDIRERNDESLHKNGSDSRSVYVILQETQSAQDHYIEQLEDTWICNSCTFRNRLENICCEICLTHQDKDINEKLHCQKEDKDIELLKGRTWTCQYCRAENLLDKYKCLSCHKVAPFFNKWICNKCSFFNDLSALNCAVCGESDNFERRIKSSKNLVDEAARNAQDIKSRSTHKGSFHGTASVEGVKDDFVYIDIYHCILCNEIIDKYTGPICRVCCGRIWYCTNRWCSTINKEASDYCYNCKLRRYSNASPYSQVDVYDGNNFVKRRQCQDCGVFRDSALCLNCFDQDLRTKLSETSKLIFGFFTNHTN